ncbi:MAG: hypothetical protein KKE37_01830 [Verrucomicrobia bacterium]|nr:hypothetical protein [Verrucomicrobiota bacterium]MBU4290036.1 hypothetical protein [Verrucomicrobiota bacterium]MBU4428075.1 hypothetical protein [Verrucomicrobiota bacterium]MCG2679594.1 hypothetical protein [Kiritimatiellia bacterium]
MTREDAIKTIQHRRFQMRAILQQNIPARELGRKLRMELDKSMICCLLSDLELGLLSVEYLNDILENGWWSEVGRSHLRKLMGRAGGSAQA